MATFFMPSNARVQIPLMAATPDGIRSAVGPAVSEVVAQQRAPGAVESSPRAQVRYIVVAYVLVIAGGVVGVWLFNSLTPKTVVAVPGLGIFSSLYVVAQAIERLFDPISEWTGTLLGGILAPTQQAASQGATAMEKVRGKSALKTRRAMAIKSAVHASLAAGGMADPVPKSVRKASQAAAKAQVAVEQDRRNSAVLLWGAASALGICASGALGLALLRSVGVQGAPVVVDIVVTGLAVGGGTKPLHDLISNLQSSADAKKDPQEVKET